MSRRFIAIYLAACSSFAAAGTAGLEYETTPIIPASDASPVVLVPEARDVLVVNSDGLPRPQVVSGRRLLTRPARVFGPAIPWHIDDRDPGQRTNDIKTILNPTSSTR